MKHPLQAGSTYQPWPRWWRIVVVATCTLILCSCRGPGRSEFGPGSTANYPPALPQQALTGPMHVPAVEPSMPPMESSIPMPVAYAGGPWVPPGMSQPWPKDEYLADGGDSEPKAMVRQDWEVRGLNLEDTIAHYDTLDGRTAVEPSNRVHIYSPRFGAVRQVVSLRQSEQRDPWAGVHQPLKLVRHENSQSATASAQNVQAEGQVSQRGLTIYRSRQGDGAISTVIGPFAFQDAFLPFEDLSVIRMGVHQASEMAWLAHGVNAAITWSSDQAVQVFLDHETAAEEVGQQRVQSTYTIKEPETSHRLRLIKVASTHHALPGEEVDFTLRFDNMGTQLIGNVTIIDNLTTRLEYIPDTAQCSLPAEFLTQENEGESLVLRWEIADAMEPGQGGIIRFRCRVR